uniref:Ankyrin-like protein n=1 Tax=Oryza sativa subsp. japonica TaxID=39947 RepID=Q6EPH1_ORYSJ|nr:ankyrin-like protein [Oryza sativa Japonica Group]BAD29449.1 ankyrin-like protein [Oryza sativa Japonica Group]
MAKTLDRLKPKKKQGSDTTCRIKTQELSQPEEGSMVAMPKNPNLLRNKKLPSNSTKIGLTEIDLALDDFLNLVATPTVPATLSPSPDGLKGGPASNNGLNTTMGTQQASSSSSSAAAAAGEERACVILYNPVQSPSIPGLARLMVSRLIGLAKTEDDNSGCGSSLKQLLRKENYLHETALQDAVRSGNKEIITEILEFDPELASSPMDGTGTSPMYIAVLLGRVDIAKLLHEMSKGNNPSYSGPEGQNALHAAALQGKDSKLAVAYLIKERPEIAGFRDSKGRTFLHVAVERKKSDIVAHASSIPSLAWILNLQDNDGSTAMHVVVQLAHIKSFCSLLRNTEVKLNIPNNKGQSPLDVSQSNIPRGTFYDSNPELQIARALIACNASTGRRMDLFLEQRQKQSDEKTESEKMTYSTQTLGVGSVLIVTVTLGAIFAIPGGYKGDDCYIS